MFHLMAGTWQDFAIFITDHMGRAILMPMQDLILPLIPSSRFHAEDMGIRLAIKDMHNKRCRDFSWYRQCASMRRT